jgi:rhodanese-related sulfurtransferase
MSGLHRFLLLTAALLGLGASATEFLSPASISALDLAGKIVSRDPTLRIFDLRPRAEYDQFHIPSAVHTTIGDLAEQAIPLDSTIVLYAESPLRAAQAGLRMRWSGFRNVLIFREGVNEWISRAHEPRLPADATEAERAEFQRAVEFSRFFGGVPIGNVPRSEIRSENRVAKIRRRGC